MHQLTMDLSEISSVGIQYRNEALAAYGLKSCHAMNLVQICSNPGISQDALTRLRHADKSSIARQAAALEEEGFITRVACCEDKRILQLYPTEKALALLPTVTEVLDRWEGLLTQDLTPPEQETLLSLLSRMKVRAAEWKEASE